MSAKKERLSQGKPLINLIKHVDVRSFSNNQPTTPGNMHQLRWKYPPLQHKIKYLNFTKSVLQRKQAPNIFFCCCCCYHFLLSLTAKAVSISRGVISGCSDMNLSTSTGSMHTRSVITLNVQHTVIIYREDLKNSMGSPGSRIPEAQPPLLPFLPIQPVTYIVVLFYL